jgi:hypothetical protein
MDDPKELTNDEKFSSFFDFGVIVDQDFVFKLCSCVRKIIVKFNANTKSGLGIEIC